MRRASWCRATALTAVLLLAISSAALADQVDGDVVDGTGDPSELVAGQAFTLDVEVYVVREGGGQIVRTVEWGVSTAGACSGITAELPDDATTELDSEWQEESNGTKSDPTTSTISGVAGASGTSCTVTYTGTPTAVWRGTHGIPPEDRHFIVELKFVDAPPTTDTTPPVITADVQGTVGDNGWYTSDVTVTWTVVDNESEITSTSGCGPTTIDEDTAGTTLTCEATSAGGTASESVTIKRDATAPNAPTSVVPPASAAGWHNSTPVTVTFTSAGDNGPSGVASCTAPQTVDAETTVAGMNVSGTCVDNAGNVSAPTTETVKVDLTDPTVALVGGPGDGASYYFGSVPAEPTCAASDALSGLAGTCTVSGYSTQVGTHTVKATATDNAGNVGSDERTYTVLAWHTAGFHRPVVDGLNVIQANRAVPLKFNVFAGPLGENEQTDTSVVKSLAIRTIACDAGDAVEEVPLTETNTGNTQLRYADGEFVYNWKTPRNPGACYRATVTLIDGSTISADFQLR